MDREEENHPPVYEQGLDELQEEVREWSQRNFPDQPPINPLMGIGEEYGELAHAVLKDRQGIRLDETGVSREAEMDAIGDIVIFLADFCSRRGHDLGECVTVAWEGKVKDREWESEYKD